MITNKMQITEKVPIYSVGQLVKTYGSKKVVDGLSFTLEPGRCLGILGPNGAGKTTTIRMLLGHVKPDSGEIRMNGIPIPQRAREARHRIGVVSQFDTLDPDFTVTENLLIFGSYFGIPERELNDSVPDLLAFASLEGKANAKLSELSGGMKRRLSIVRALVNKPDVLVLDEPTTGLDPQARHLIWQRLRSLVRDGISILLTTHFMEEAERLCDDLIVMDNGKAIVSGSPGQLVKDNLEPEVVEVSGDSPEALTENPEFLSKCLRHEMGGDILYVYTDSANELLTMIDPEKYRALSRKTDLEDLFIKVAGRTLKD